MAKLSCISSESSKFSLNAVDITYTKYQLAASMYTDNSAKPGTACAKQL